MKTTATAAASIQPVVWTFLGYQFEAGSMIAGLFSCLAVRMYMGAKNKSREGWTADIAVTTLSLLFTAGWIMMQRPTPFYALMAGTGLGALGAGIIKIAERQVRRFEAFADPIEVDDAEAIRQLTERMKDGEV